jgi:hypothetical protein
MVREGLVQARRNKDFTLDEYEEGSTKERVEGVGEGTVYQELLEQYKDFLRIGHMSYSYISTNRTVVSVLDPTQMDFFVSYVLASKTDLLGFGIFMTRVLKNSYQAGHRKFKLNLGDNSINRLFTFYELDMPNLEITITGQTGTHFGIHAVDSTFCGENFEEFCGANSKKSTYRGNNLGYSCGEHSKGSLFVGKIFEGRSGDGSKGSIFEGERFGFLCGGGAIGSNFTGLYFGRNCGDCSKESIFKTPNLQTLQQLLGEVPQGRGNKVVLITPTGEEIERYSNWWD